MTSKVDHAKLLDQLQTEVNRVLEQTGRVFAAATSKDVKVSPMAQATKLKHMIPDSSNRFHEALDNLEEELRLARLVLRRDLALLRGQSQAAKDKEDSSTKHSQDPIDAIANDADSTDAIASGDPMMLDSNPTTGDDDAGQRDTKASPDVEKSPLASTSVVAHSQPQPLPDIPNVPDSNVVPTSAESRPVLKTDPSPTSKTPPDDGEIPPDTAGSNGVDLESLFGPNSAAVGGDGDFSAENDEAFDFTFENEENDTNANAASDNNNIETFLPGLSDYANTQPAETNNGAADSELEALLADFAAPAASAPKENEQQNGEEEHSLDDLLDFAELASGDFDTSGDGGGGNDDFEFSYN